MNKIFWLIAAFLLGYLMNRFADFDPPATQHTYDRSTVAMYPGLEKDAYDRYDLSTVNNKQFNVRFIAAKNVIAECNAESHRRGLGGFGSNTTFQACSFQRPNECHVIVSEYANNDNLGHEFHHCLIPMFHK